MLIPVYKNGEIANFSLVDDGRTDLLQHKYYLDTYGYARRSISRAGITKDRYLHHDVLATEIGCESLHHVCDHINRDKLDNRKLNLRMCSASQNGYNRSGVTGVSKHKSSGKYESNLTRNGKKIFLGLYESERTAMNAYKFAKAVIANDKYNGGTRPPKISYRYAEHVIKLRKEVLQ